MKFHFQAVPHHPVASAAPAPPAPAVASPAAAFVDSTAPSPVTPSVRIQHLEVEGCGPISASGLREGFRDAWQRGSHASPDWNASSGDRFRAPLALHVTPGLSGRELGRRLAEAILTRAAAPRRG